jgi:hypothetical protein
LNSSPLTKMPHFTYYFESFLQTPEHMYMGHFKYVKVF